MGAFFTNVQVLAGENPPAARERLVAAIVSYLGELGFSEPKEGEEPDRSVLVGSDGRWISVYDEVTEGQREDDLHAFAAHLSSALGTIAVSVLVHDSDVLRLGLFEEGKKLAEFDSFPGYFGGKKKKQKTPVKPWAKCLAPGHDTAELAQVFEKEKLFAEDTLERVAALTGMDFAQAALGFRYAERSELEFTSLRFRADVRPAHETEGGASGPPRFELGAHSPSYELSVGEALHVGLGVRNEGGASKGVDVVVWGPPVAEGLLALGKAELVVGNPGERAFSVAEFERRSGAGGLTIWVAAFPDVELPSGIGGDIVQSGLDPMKAMELWLGAGVHTNVKGDVLAPGEGVLGVGFVPHGHVEGQCGHECRIVVHAAPRRPLRAKAPEGQRPRIGDMQTFRALETETVLFGLAACDLEKRAAAVVAAPIIERWVKALPGRGSYSITVFPSDERARPKTDTFKAEKLLQGARFERLREELASERLVSVDRRDAASPESFSVKSDGFAFGSSLIASTAEGEIQRPALALWMNVAKASPDAVAAARALLTELIDELVLDAKGMQGLVGCWDWQPSTLDSTPYEIASGVHGQCTLLRSWLTRFLRGVTRDSIWLGPDLLGRVERHALEKVAHVTPHGAGIRLRLREGSSLDELEAALAPLLPGDDEWKAGLDRYYGRVN